MKILPISCYGLPSLLLSIVIYKLFLPKIGACTEFKILVLKILKITLGKIENFYFTRYKCNLLTGYILEMNEKKLNLRGYS